MALQRDLQHLLRENEGHIAIGTVSAVTQHAAFGWLVDLVLQPSQREVQARVAGWGPVYVPVVVGQEVAVFFPDADPNAAILLPGLPSLAAPPPLDWSNASVRVEGGEVPVEVASGLLASRVLLTLGPDGTATIAAPAGIKLQGAGEAVDFVALATKVDLAFQQLSTVLSAWAPVAGDGGAVLKAALSTLISSGWPASTAATTTKAE